jgi:hypothetical protein
MQYYTKQQIQGATRFQPKVLIGNWNEDRQVQECVLQDFVERKEAGNLHIHKCATWFLLCVEPDFDTITLISYPLLCSYVQLSGSYGDSIGASGAYSAGAVHLHAYMHDAEQEL